MVPLIDNILFICFGPLLPEDFGEMDFTPILV